MGNLCSIHHAHFDKLVELTKSHNKAVFLDKCLFWWQISTYTLNDGQIWFTRKLEEIAGEVGLSERSISRFLTEFETLGLIERQCKLSASTKNNHFSVSKRLYIRITDTLLALLKTESKSTSTTNKKPETCSFLTQDGEIEKDNLAVSINKDNDYKSTNITVSVPLVGDKKAKTVQSLYPNYPVEQLIGERIDEASKNYIKGMMHNLHKQHGVNFSNPEQVFAEIVFAVLNPAQLQHVETLAHKIQIIAKLSRQKRWCTPKGFYNHADYGAYFERPKDVKTRSVNKPNPSRPSVEAYEKQKTMQALTRELHAIQHTITTNKRYRDDLMYASNTVVNEQAMQTLHKEINQLQTEERALQQALDGLASDCLTLAIGDAELNAKHQRLNTLQDEAERLNALSINQFEVFCTLSKTLPQGDSEIDASYAHYEQLKHQLRCIGNEIAQLEEDLFFTKVA